MAIDGSDRFAVPNMGSNPLMNRQADMHIISQLKMKVRTAGKKVKSVACPKCKKGKVSFTHIPELDLFKLKCSKEGCIDVDELEVG